jgi:hypothetical protein
MFSYIGSVSRHHRKFINSQGVEVENSDLYGGTSFVFYNDKKGKYTFS